MSLKKFKTTHEPSVEAKIITLLQKCLPKKIAQKHFSLRESTTKFIKKMWEVSSNNNPILKFGFTVKTLKLADCSCQWVYKKEEDKNTIVFYLHGGAYLGGNLAEARHKSLRYPVHTGCALFVVSYRVSAVGRYPCALEDALSGYNTMLKSAKPNSKIIVIGDSAGGGLALAMVKKLKEEGIKVPDKIILNSPWVDLTCSSKSYKINANKDPILHKNFVIRCAHYYAGKKSMLKNEYVSPLFCDFSGFPPINIHVGTNEILLSDSIKLAKKASAQNVDVKLKIWNGMFHMFHFYEGIIPESTQACEDIYNEILN